MKTLATLLASCIIGTSCGYFAADAAVRVAAADSAPDAPQAAAAQPVHPVTNEGRNLAGDYLSSLFAQRHHDWKKAGEYLSDVMRVTPDEPSLSKRAMVLALGAGDMDSALRLAQKVVNDPDGAALAHLFLAVGALHEKKYQDAADNIKEMPSGGLSDFIMPLLVSWTQAGVGKLDVAGLDKNTIHIHHATLIADFLKQPANISDMLDKLVAQGDMTPEDMERVGNLYAHIGQNDKALKLYQKILEQWPDDPDTLKKIDVLKSGQKLETLVPVNTPEQGVSASLYDMANLLFRQYADDSARVFAQMSLYLTPNMMDGRLLLAAIDARSERYDEAIASYKMIPPDSAYYLEAQRKAAELMEDNGDIPGALEQLNGLVKNHDDLESLIKIGDIYRRQENFAKAIETYDAAVQKLGGKVPKEYWNILYARGMSYERSGQWDKAEADLKGALAYQPDQPYVLNYLGYAWADHGMNLDQALELVKKAATLQPNDGYIVDSYGWVLYKMGRRDEALPHLEKAVELLPYDSTVNDHLGDAYWQSGRKREARFQWQRAENYSQDQEFIVKMNQKITDGLPPPAGVKEAHSSAPAAPAEGETAIP